MNNVVIFFLVVVFIFLTLLIIAQIILFIKRIKINNKLKEETKQELKNIKKTNKINDKILNEIQKLVHRIVVSSSKNQHRKLRKHFLKLKDDYYLLTKEYKEKIVDELLEVILGVFDEFYNNKKIDYAKDAYFFALRLYDFLIENNEDQRSKEDLYYELRDKYYLLNKILK